MNAVLCEDEVEEVLSFLHKYELVSMAMCSKAWYTTIFHAEHPLPPPLVPPVGAPPYFQDDQFSAFHRRHCFTTTSGLNKAWLRLLFRQNQYHDDDEVDVVSTTHPHNSGASIPLAFGCRIDHHVQGDPNSDTIRSELEIIKQYCRAAYDEFGSCEWHCLALPEAMSPLLEHYLDVERRTSDSREEAAKTPVHLRGSSRALLDSMLKRMFLNVPYTQNAVPRELIPTTIASNFEHAKFFPERRMPFAVCSRQDFLQHLDEAVIRGMCTAPSSAGAPTGDEFFRHTFEGAETETKSWSSPLQNDDETSPTGGCDAQHSKLCCEEDHHSCSANVSAEDLTPTKMAPRGSQQSPSAARAAATRTGPPFPPNKRRGEALWFGVMTEYAGCTRMPLEFGVVFVWKQYTDKKTLENKEDDDCPPSLTSTSSAEPYCQWWIVGCAGNTE